MAILVPMPKMSFLNFQKDNVPFILFSLVLLSVILGKLVEEQKEKPSNGPNMHKIQPSNSAISFLPKS